MPLLLIYTAITVAEDAGGVLFRGRDAVVVRPGAVSHVAHDVGYVRMEQVSIM